MTLDDPSPDLGDWRLPAQTGEQAARRHPHGQVGRLQRPDGRWQVGVGPGAVLVDGVVPSGLADTLVRGIDGIDPVDHAPRCPVLGAGPLASRLRSALGGLEPVAATDGLTVSVHQYVVPLEVGLRTAQEGRLALPVVVQPRRVVIGPVVGPFVGSAGVAPCLHCLDLHRRDRDPAWAAVATSLGHPVQSFDPLPLGSPILTAAEGLTLLLVATVQHGRRCAPGLAYEFGSGTPHVVARHWTVHPACRWHRPEAGGC